MSTMDQFRSFFSTYSTAMLAGDEDALRQTLPPGIPDEHFAFLMDMNQGFFAQAAADGIEPEFEQRGDCFVAHYEMNSDDGEETMDREFWWHEDRWVSFDPNE